MAAAKIKLDGGLWLVVPAFGRPEVSKVCFAGLAWTCSELRKKGIDAHALVVADDGNLRLAEAAGLDTLTRPNKPLGKKWNDGYEHAFKQHGAAYAMACGSDDWVSPGLITAMVNLHLGLEESRRDRVMVCCRESCAVRSDGAEIATLKVTYESGDGVRLLSRGLLERVKFRPTEDARNRAIDGGMRDRLKAVGPVEFEYVDLLPEQIVDFKSKGTQLTDYQLLVRAYGVKLYTDPWVRLRAVYPKKLIEIAQELYA